MFGMRKRTFLVEQLQHTLLVLRPFTTDYFSTQIYMLIVAALCVAQYVKEGFTPRFLVLFPLLCLQIFAELNQLEFLQYVTSMLGAGLHFFPLKMYWLPEPRKIVGFREDILDKDLHYIEFYPLDEDQKIVLTSMKWNYTKEVAKMLEYKKISHHLAKKIGHMILSYADKHRLKIGVGEEKKTDKSIVFCHGRGATPFLNSSLLIHFAGLGYRVGGVQHSEVNDTKQKTKDDCKSYREKEVQVRAAEMYQAIIKLDNKQIVLMGHSYGCATLIQAYHSLQPQIQSKVTNLVLLDPWFFPLTEQILKKQISCPVLILANEDFIKNPDMYIRNRKFLVQHKNDKVEYILWKNGHHLHQSDMGFINGNLLQAVKHSHMSQIFHDLNNEAIEKVLRGEKAEGTFEEKDLGREYTPDEFYSQQNFTY